MNLLEMLEKIQQEKADELFKLIKKRIEKVNKKEIDDTIEYNKKIFFQEKQSLFNEIKSPYDYYHWIDRFAGEISLLKGAPYSLEEKLSIIRKRIRGLYKGHPYLPNIKIFLKQNDEELVIKLAHYNAYCSIQELFYKSKSEFKKKLKQPILGIILEESPKEDVNEKYRSLFKTQRAFDICEGIIIEYLMDEHGKWVGHTGKLQEIPALVNFLEEHDFIKFNSFTMAVKAFCWRLQVTISDRATRTKGYAYTDAYKFYQGKFPLLKRS